MPTGRKIVHVHIFYCPICVRRNDVCIHSPNRLARDAKLNPGTSNERTKSNDVPIESAHRVCVRKQNMYTEFDPY